MNKVLFLISLVTFSKGFLLDNSNTSLPFKQTYLTVAEYYGDSSRLHHEQEAYRDRQEQALKLLANQLQQKLLAMEQKINEKNQSQQQSLNLSEQTFRSELEKKYLALQDTVGKWEHKYQELEQNYTKLIQNYTKLEQMFGIQNQMCMNNDTKLQTEIDNINANADYTTNKTKDLQQEIQQLKNLKSVNQLQTLSKLTDKVNTFDSRISFLSGHEQSRNQDFLALYNLTTATSNRLTQLEVENNASLIRLRQKEEQTRYNLTNRLDVLANVTSNKMDLMIQSQNSSLIKIQQTIVQNNKKVVLVGCNEDPSIPHYAKGSTYKFPIIVTKVGLPNLTAFPSTGKFICPDNGIYQILAVLTTDANNVDIEIMKNSVRMHRQFVTGNYGGYWTPGAAIIALELNVNDTIWIKTNTASRLYYSSCLTIFKV